MQTAWTGLLLVMEVDCNNVTLHHEELCNCKLSSAENNNSESRADHANLRLCKNCMHDSDDGMI